MGVRRDAHPGAVGTKSLSFFEGAVKPSLKAQRTRFLRVRRHFKDKTAVDAVREIAGLGYEATQAVPPGSVASQREPPEVAPRGDNESLARPGSAHIIVAHLMDKHLPPLALHHLGRDSGFF